MKRCILFILIILVMLPFTLWSEAFYHDLNQAQRFELSQAYLAVSEHYKDEGDNPRSESYKTVADMLLASIAELSNSESTESTAQVDEAMDSSTTEMVEVMNPVEERTQRAILYYFNKTGSAIIAGNVDKAIEGMSFPFEAGDYSVSEERIREDLNTLMTEYEVSLYTLDYIWDLDAATFAWDGEDVILTLPTKVLDPGIFIFWQDPQDFRFIKAERGWKLSALE